MGAHATRTREARRARRLLWLRKLVLGDWHPLLRDPLDLLRLSFAVAAVPFFAAESVEYGVRLSGSFLLVVGAQRLRVPRLFDLLFIVGMALQAWGNALRLFEDVSWWDNLVHYAVPFSTVPVFYVLFLRLGLVPDIAEEEHPRYRLGLVLFAVMTGLSAGALYEIYEYVAVKWLDAPLAIGYADTVSDLTLDALGSLAGGVVLMVWATASWHTERRPGL